MLEAVLAVLREGERPTGAMIGPLHEPAVQHVFAPLLRDDFFD